MQREKTKATEKKKRIPRRDRFRRTRNKEEAVYRAPAFLKHTVGLTEISESGIFACENSFNKVYKMETGGQKGKLGEIMEELQRMDVRYGISADPGEKDVYLVLHIEKKDMEEAAEWFSQMKDLLGSGLNAEERFGEYTGFLENFFGVPGRAGSYILETDQWKEAAQMEEIHKKIFSVIAVRSFPEDTAGISFLKLGKLAGVRGIYGNVMPVSDRTVINAIHAEYLGLEGILPRLKRNAPLMYELLSREEGSTEDKRYFARAGVYFLLEASGQEELDRQTEDFRKETKKMGLLTEPVPLGQLGMGKEARSTLAMFGKMGTVQERYQCFIPVSRMKEWTGEKNVEDPEQKYDIEELRMLFFDGEPEE